MRTKGFVEKPKVRIISYIIYEFTKNVFEKGFKVFLSCFY